MRIIALSIVAATLLVPVLSAADPLPTTVLPEERERHEFRDAQRGVATGIADRMSQSTDCDSPCHRKMMREGMAMGSQRHAEHMANMGGHRR
jgi:hypothetical protein